METTPSTTTTLEQPTATARPAWTRYLGWGIAFAALIALLAIVYAGLQRTSEGPIVIGDQVPDFVVQTFDGESHRLSDYRGQVVVLNFWASWCKPCEQEAAELEQAWQLYAPSQQVMFLGVDYVDTEPEALAYLSKFNITYPNGPDLGTRISQAFRITGVPETYFIDKEGRLAYAQYGPFISLAQIQQIIEPLMAQ